MRLTRSIIASILPAIFLASCLDGTGPCTVMGTTVDLLLNDPTPDAGWFRIADLERQGFDCRPSDLYNEQGARIGTRQECSICY